MSSALGVSGDSVAAADDLLPPTRMRPLIASKSAVHIHRSAIFCSSKQGSKFLLVRVACTSRMALKSSAASHVASPYRP